MKKAATIFFLLICLLLALVCGSASANEVRIGVLSLRGPEDSLKYWQQVADHLNLKIPDHHFIIIPHTYQSMDQAVDAGQLEFVIANPAEYIEFEVKYGVSRIATLVNHVGTIDSSYFGAVIFAKADRPDISTISDLKGKSLAVATKTAFASWLVTRDELKKHGISSGNLAAVRFVGSSADSVVMAVKNREADVGAVRTNVLEQLAQEGKIALTDFRIVGQKHVEGFPFLLSSQLYPEFAFARLKNTDRLLANKVAAFLLLEAHDRPGSRYPNLIGWTVPDNYENVRKLLLEWELPPYQNHNKIPLTNAIRQHWIIFSLALTAAISITTIAFLILNIRQRKKKYRNLNEAKQKLDLIHAMIIATPDAIFIKDKQGRYVFVNPEAAYIIGKPIEVIIGKDDLSLFPSHVATAMMDDDSSVMSRASSISYEEQLELADGLRYLLVTKGPMYDSNGSVDGLFIVARDITDLKLLQKKNTEKVAQLEVALANVRLLEGIIPICSYCKCIRDDKESWHQMENYISNHSGAQFSHGICPECYEKQLLEIKAMKI